MQNFFKPIFVNNSCSRTPLPPPLFKCFIIFYMHLGKAVLQYENEGNNTMNMYHTMVPSEYRGKGIAGHLAKVSGC